MQTKTFFRVAIVLPGVLLLALWLWEPRLWQSVPDSGEHAPGIRVLAFATSWLKMGGAHYIVAALLVLYGMERVRSRSQMQLLFALSPVVFFLVCGAISLLQNFASAWFGIDVGNAPFAGVLLALATLTLGSVYAFIMSVVFICWKRRRPARKALPAFLPALGD